MWPAIFSLLIVDKYVDIPWKTWGKVHTRFNNKGMSTLSG